MKKDRPKIPEPLKKKSKEKLIILTKILKRLTVNKRQKAPKKRRSKQPQIENESEKSIKKLISPEIINITQIGRVSFIYLIKKKNYKLFTIIIRDINKYLKKRKSH